MIAVGPGGVTYSPEEIADYREAARIMGVIPYVEAEFAKVIHSTELEVYRKLDAGSLTPQEAIMAWATKRSIEKVLRNLNTRAKLGTTIMAGEK